MNPTNPTATQHSKHPTTAPAWTPGPWKVTPNGNVIARNGCTIATVEEMPGRNPDERAANATLIALAPEMARTIASLTDYLESWWESAGSPVHATELEIMDARAILARIHGEGGGV